MEQIRCPRCKERHWVCAEVVALLKAPEKELAYVGSVVAKLEAKVKADRRVYMREYMRKRRAK